MYRESKCIRNVKNPRTRCRRYFTTGDSMYLLRKRKDQSGS